MLRLSSIRYICLKIVRRWKCFCGALLHILEFLIVIRLTPTTIRLLTRSPSTTLMRGLGLTGCDVSIFRLVQGFMEISPRCWGERPRPYWLMIAEPWSLQSITEFRISTFIGTAFHPASKSYILIRVSTNLMLDTLSGLIYLVTLFTKTVLIIFTMKVRRTR